MRNDPQRGGARNEPPGVTVISLESPQLPGCHGDNFLLDEIALKRCVTDLADTLARATDQVRFISNLASPLTTGLRVGPTGTSDTTQLPSEAIISLQRDLANLFAAVVLAGGSLSAACRQLSALEEICKGARLRLDWIRGERNRVLAAPPYAGTEPPR